ncbi:uncharacterized protein LOC131227930 [Magnolia sinica]|uniref:uncharacterized protein LOC131227930 n=1 Tax=Magnolia sinica TaxID=86752 RepID=UPI0026592E9F|nr:uncharacterized protein LOC131227930 [Magnolia sinica]
MGPYIEKSRSEDEFQRIKGTSFASLISLSCWWIKNKMPHRTRPMTALLVFKGVNVVLVSTITPVYDFVCFHPYWERRRERRRQEREAAMAKGPQSSSRGGVQTYSFIQLKEEEKKRLFIVVMVFVFTPWVCDCLLKKNDMIFNLRNAHPTLVFSFYRMISK